MMNTIKKVVSLYKNGRKDWRTKKKLLIFESDDWGSIRLPSKQAFLNLKKLGYPVNNCPFLRHDSLETPEDFSALIDTFNNIYKKHGKRPVLTLNYILSNPDFNQISRSEYKDYFKVPLWETLKTKGIHDQYVDMLNVGIEYEFFKPQYHGREHVNIDRWLNALMSGSAETMDYFNHHVYGISTTISRENRKTYMATYDYESEEELSQIRNSISEGLDMFQLFFGYRSITSISPNYVWDDAIEKSLMENGVNVLQSGRFQFISSFSKPKLGKRLRHHIGEKNQYGQIYLVRNAFFEPATVGDKNLHLRHCLNNINTAFMLNRPCIISTHRLNYVNGFSKHNRDENIVLLERLISKVIKRWPSVEFISSDELGQRIIDSNG